MVIGQGSDSWLCKIDCKTLEFSYVDMKDYIKDPHRELFTALVITTDMGIKVPHSDAMAKILPDSLSSALSYPTLFLFTLFRFPSLHTASSTPAIPT